MKIEILQLHFDPIRFSAVNSKIPKSSIADFFKSDIAICYGGKTIHFLDAALMEFYLSLRGALADVLMRGVTSDIYHDYEHELTFIPSPEGCSVSDPRPSYPFYSADLTIEELDFKAVRSLICDLEEQIRVLLQPHRSMLFFALDAMNSSVLFELLKVIDGASVVRSDI